MGPVSAQFLQRMEWAKEDFKSRMCREVDSLFSLFMSELKTDSSHSHYQQPTPPRVALNNVGAKVYRNVTPQKAITNQSANHHQQSVNNQTSSSSNHQDDQHDKTSSNDSVTTVIQPGEIVVVDQSIEHFLSHFDPETVANYEKQQPTYNPNRPQTRQSTSKSANKAIAVSNEYQQDAHLQTPRHNIMDDQMLYYHSDDHIEDLIEVANTSERTFNMEEWESYLNEDALSGQSIYLINRETEFDYALVDGKFSPLHFVLGRNSQNGVPDPAERYWSTQPIIDFKEEFEKGLVSLAQFPQNLKQFTKNVYARLSNIYPYEVPPRVMIQINTVYSTQCPELAHYFIEYKKKFPNTKVGIMTDVGDYLYKIVRNKFKMRGRELKQEGVWVYRSEKNKEQFEQQKIESIKNHKKVHERRQKRTFDYTFWKPRLEKKIVDLDQARHARLEAREERKRKRLRAD